MKKKLLRERNTPVQEVPVIIEQPKTTKEQPIKKKKVMKEDD